jgi:hypothetical protein
MSAKEKVFDRELAAAMSGNPQFPDGTEFVSYDMKGLEHVLYRAYSNGHPVAIVYSEDEVALWLPS